ncbi:MAG: gamma-glutamyltranspeptidase / glutathione hydrolase [Actinomycetota bacterium]|jgi:gamma-glutamyltranspeptidase/glutathione hydrolase|nr:gamma-glutamyltranspeptidase / glutathione hydrolase [Actinomycetota bacterium]
MRQRVARTTVSLAALAALSITLAGTPASAEQRSTTKSPTAVGHGGAVATVDADATRVGLDVLRKGGNAVDAAVAAAATLGVTEPFSSGIGGGGFFVYYDARTHQVQTIDGRETAPAAMNANSFDGLTFNDAVTSGLSVGVPGSPATWQEALDRWGTLSLAQALTGGRQVAGRGFVVDSTFRQQVADNADRFNDFTSTRDLYLPGGSPPAVGTIFKNPALADTYQQLGERGVNWLYDGALAREIVNTVQHPPLAPDANRTPRSGLMTTSDLAAYTAPLRQPTHVVYRGLDVYGMAPPSSGGSTVGEALNILDNVNLSAMTRTQALHYYLEASALAYADRGAYLGDPSAMTVSLNQLLSQGFADERFCNIDPAHAMTKPVPAGQPDGSYDTDCNGTADTTVRTDREGKSTTHLTVVDRWGNTVAYTLTIESTGGNAMVVPGRGFLLNNELTDFNFPNAAGQPNAPGPGKRPRSSMSPTIVLDHGSPLLALGSPGGSTIITTVLQTLINRLDLGMTLPQAIAEPRATQRNTASVQAETTFDPAQRAALEALGHTFTVTPPPGEIGAATGIEFLADGRLLAAAEPVRRGGGSAGVVSP